MSDDKKIKPEEKVENEVKDAASCGCPDCDKLKAELADCTAGWQRALADYQNLQKETEKRRGEWAEYFRQMILEEFLPVYEHLKLAINNEQLTKANGDNGWIEGVKHVARQFAEVLKNNGVEEIKTVGEKFDPALHEAVGQEVSPSPLPEGGHRGEGVSGIIIREISGGYKMGERVIRAAKVIVSK